MLIFKNKPPVFCKPLTSRKEQHLAKVQNNILTSWLLVVYFCSLNFVRTKKSLSLQSELKKL
jgi:hypothetical protein